MTNQTLTQLRSAISDMDCLSQGGFSSIAAIAKLALAALENPLTCGDIDSIAAACVFRTNVTGDFGIVTEDSGPS